MQRHFLVLLASGGATSVEGKESARIGGGVEAGEGPGGGMEEGWSSFTGDGAGSCMSAAEEAAGSCHQLQRQQRHLRSTVVAGYVAGMRQEITIS